MASTISNEEFQRLQSQLLDLRASNYTLMEESNRYKNDLRNTAGRLDLVEKEYQKAQRALEKSRKAKDVEMLFAENDALQNKLVSQEEQFREQNQALLQELAILVAANEKLEKSSGCTSSAESVKESSEQGCQCDLTTEHHEKLLLSLREDSALKDSEIAQLNFKMSEMMESTSSKIDNLNKIISSLQIEADKVPSLLKVIEENSSEKKETASEIATLQSKFEEMEESLRREIDLIHKSHEEELEKLRALHAEELKQFEIQVELASAQRSEFEDEAIKARQEREDALEDVRIADRKRLTDTADLRRQLRGERKRADKLQERLRDFIAGSDNNALASPSGGQIPSGGEHDNCSVSSWSLMSGQNESVNNPATPSSPYPTTDSPGSGSEKNGSGSGNGEPDLTAENARLVARLATMQQDKWKLEERVLHLEETNSAMADEMVKRGKLIQHYCMEGRAPNNHLKIENGEDKMSVRRMVSLIRDAVDGDADGQQRRIHQRMLEETLTKNMHLQEDIERLSQEVVRLSQLVGSSGILN